MAYQFEFAALLPYWDEFLRGIGLTLLLSVLAVAIGFVIGLVTVLARRSRWAGLRLAAVSYVEVIRNTPFLLQVMFIFFGLPSAGVSLTPWPAAILALSLNCGAFASEIIRGGIDAIPRGQGEAGLALGLSPLQVFRYVILKPALRIIYPALSSQFILALLTTSIVSSISAEELTSVAQSVDTLTFRSFEIYVVVTLIYFALSSVFAAAFRAIDRAFFSYPVK
jgi:polar amino acid transport system permease protein